MQPNLADPMTLLRLTLPFVTIAGSGYTLCTRIKDELRSIRQRLSAIGPCGIVFMLSVVYPVHIYSLAALILALASLTSITAGVLLLQGVALPVWLVSAFLYSFWEIVLLGLLYICVVFNPLARFFLFVFSWWQRIRFGPSWINAKWHLSDGSDSPAINTDEDAIRALSNTVFLTARTQKQSPLPGQAPVPEGLSQDELANYLLIACSIESCIAELYPQNFNLVKCSWQYLCSIAGSSKRPFRPDTIRAQRDTGRSYYEFLSSIGTPAAGNDYSLPASPDIEKTVDAAFERLAVRYRGCGSRLAKSRIWPIPRQKKLFKRLNDFERFRGDSGEYIKRLYLKIAVRMDVWPGLVPGMFLYPFSTNVSLFMLNSGSLVSWDKTEFIPIEDKDFQNLCIGCEHEVVGAVFEHFVATKDNSETVAFSNAVFRKEPYQVRRWAFHDYVDLWLWSHASRYCSQHSAKRDGEAPDCPLIPEGGRTCVCASRQKTWRREGKKLYKE